MRYLEELPEQCPPAEATNNALGPAFRILPSAQPAIEHFHSYKKLGLPKPDGVDDCRYVSCSLFTEESRARKIAGLPKKRAASTHLAKLMIPHGVGAALVNEKTKHVDFWMFDTFNVAAAVEEVVAL